MVGMSEKQPLDAQTILDKKNTIVTWTGKNLKPYDEYILTQGQHGYSYGHAAIDISAGKGATIYSPINGSVTENYVDQYGNNLHHTTRDTLNYVSAMSLWIVGQTIEYWLRTSSQGR